MAYVTRGAASATVRIPECKGLMQYGDGVGLDPRYATECSNASTAQGVLQPMAACTLLPAKTPAPIQTLARLYRRWYAPDEQHEVLIAASGGQLYWMLPGGEHWTRLSMPYGWTQPRYLSDVWSWAAYEINVEDRDAPVDVLLMSNAMDGMICIRGDTMAVSAVATPKKFGVIARYAERIWGGGIPDDPDMLLYSAPYDPFDWAQNDEIPEDGAGDVLQPSWDGDSFTALTPFGSQLIALKKTRVWRVLGTDPGTYVFKEQYGGGTPCPQTVAVDGSRILMLGREGVLCYDGESVAPFQQAFAHRVFARINPAALSEATACMWRGTYYCALALDDSPVNNAVVMFNTRENTWLLRTDAAVESFLPTEDALYFTSSTTPGRIWLWQEDCMQAGQAQPMRWVVGWQNLQAHDVTKRFFRVYLCAECLKEATVRLTMETENGVRTKTVVFSPGQTKQRCVPFHLHGRRFRLTVESDGGAAWRLLGGMHIEMDTEED
ncbi:MAG: hypothetical protein IKK75_00010 [Clostridia bacterium]|nr:hypothetical protein [Clostridia bacterium]